MKFFNFVGNEELKEQLSLAFEENRLPHAIILEGAEGCGKRTLAQIIAQAAVCLGDGEKPCGKCAGCIKARAGSHPDIYTTGGSGGARSFHVETIRHIREDTFIKPNEAPHKVYLLVGAENMSEQAQNALLKILEEPPPQVLFLLTCVSSASLLPTVRSRSQIFTLNPVSESQAENAVAPLFPQTSREQIEECAKTWGGNIGQMIAALSGETSTQATELASQVAQAVVASGEALLLQVTAPLVKEKDLLRTVLGRLLLIVRDACAMRAGSCSLLSGDSKSAELLSSRLTRDRLLLMMDTITAVQTALEKNANMALLITCFCAKLRDAAGC